MWRLGNGRHLWDIPMDNIVNYGRVRLLHTINSIQQWPILTKKLVDGSFSLLLHPSNRPTQDCNLTVLPSRISRQQEHPRRNLHCIGHHHSLHDCVLLGTVVAMSSSR